MLYRKNLVIGSALALASLGMLSSAAQAQSVFSDVPDNHWAAAAIKRLAEVGIVIGVETKITTGSIKAASVTSRKKAAGARHEIKPRAALAR